MVYAECDILIKIAIVSLGIDPRNSFCQRCQSVWSWKGQTQMSSKRHMPPEFDLLILSFPMHFTWEFLQAPLFRNMLDAKHVDGIRICLQATLGDMVIALISFWMIAFLVGTRQWTARPNRDAIGAWLSTGLATTIALEFYSTEVAGRWSYDTSMLRLPVIGTGIGPVAQWIVVPMLVLWYMHRLSAKPTCSDLADR